MKSDEFNASTEWRSPTNSRVNGRGQEAPDTDQQHTRRISKLFVVEIIVLLAKWRLIYLKLLFQPLLSCVFRDLQLSS